MCPLVRLTIVKGGMAIFFNLAKLKSKQFCLKSCGGGLVLRARLLIWSYFGLERGGEQNRTKVLAQGIKELKIII